MARFYNAVPVHDMALCKTFTPTLLAYALALIFAGGALAAPAAPESGGKLAPGETRVTADQLDGQMEVELKARGNVYVERDDQTVTADWLNYYQPENRAEAGDRFKLTQENNTVYGCNLNYNLTDRTGNATDADFDAYSGKNRFRGTSNEVEFQGKNLYQLNQAKVNTCDPGDDSWYLRASRVNLDYNTNIGVARNAWLQFEGVPIMYSPWMDFPLNNQRKSGFLTPTLKSGSNGFEIALPYYFNLAPNYDLTVTPDYMEKRGLMLGAEFRYLQPNYTGKVYTEQLPNDREDNNKDRWLWRLTHQQNNLLFPGVGMNIDFTQVSDNDYFKDFGDRYSIAENTNLNREINFNRAFSLGKLNAGAFVRWQRYQTLQNDTNTVDVPYARLPQVLFNLGANWDNGLNFNMFNEWTYFSSATKQEGRRLISYPSVAWNLNRTWGFLRPKVGLNYTFYDLDTFNENQARTATRTLPIVSVDSGLYFERNTTGRGDTQTLEPRLYYVYIPTKNQDNLPNFDTSLNDFNYAQLFTENRFSGGDRINGANALTAALTTRYIDNNTGLERIRLAVGQRYYFQKDDITLAGNVARIDKAGSDILLSVGGDITRALRLDSNYHYDQEVSTTGSFDASLVYNPAPGKTASLRYRYERNGEIYDGVYGKLSQIDVAAQWPVARRWYVVARQNYSLEDSKSLETLAGFEYNDGCWILRIVGQRYVTDINDTKNAIFFQLELKNLGGLGNDPFETLRLSIPGYSKINEIPQ